MHQGDCGEQSFTRKVKDLELQRPHSALISVLLSVECDVKGFPNNVFMSWDFYFHSDEQEVEGSSFWGKWLSWWKIWTIKRMSPYLDLELCSALGWCHAILFPFPRRVIVWEMWRGCSGHCQGNGDSLGFESHPQLLLNVSSVADLHLGSYPVSKAKQLIWFRQHSSKAHNCFAV